MITNKNNMISDYEQVPYISDKNCLAEIGYVTYICTSDWLYYKM